MFLGSYIFVLFSLCSVPFTRRCLDASSVGYKMTAHNAGSRCMCARTAATSSRLPLALSFPFHTVITWQLLNFRMDLCLVLLKLASRIKSAVPLQTLLLRFLWRTFMICAVHRVIIRCVSASPQIGWGSDAAIFLWLRWFACLRVH